jgi:hypothetical protein
MKLMIIRSLRMICFLLIVSNFSFAAETDQVNVTKQDSTIKATADTNLIAPVTVKTYQLELGLLFQKSYHFYWENGITATYRSSFLMKNQLGLGFNFMSSRIGTAMGTNAIKQEQFLIFGQYDFRPGKSIRPFVQLNVGYIKAKYDQTYFSALPDQSMLTSVSVGVTGKVKENFVLKGSLGCNIISGNGESGLATIYPLIFQLSAQYIMKK